MVRQVINKLIRKISNPEKYLADFQEKTKNEPLNVTIHFQYAVYALKINRPYLAFAELKTALFLGLAEKETQNYKNKIIAALPLQESLNHNQYYRLSSLATELNNRSTKKNFSVLDVGGGEGQLASFIPDASYCLAEPDINGISGINLPFPNSSFDYVVSCHVLEHIPVEDRDIFLDQLLSKSKYGLILLNPFYIEGSSVEERLQLIIDITDASWAKEHLECTLPTLDYIEKYASHRNLEISIKPNGTLTTSLALVFFDNSPSNQLKRNKINTFFNKKLSTILDSDKYPTGHMIYISKVSDKKI